MRFVGNAASQQLLTADLGWTPKVVLAGSEDAAARIYWAKKTIEEMLGD